DALFTVRGQLRDARHRIDRTRRIALTVVEAAKGLERGNVAVVQVDDVLVCVDGSIDVRYLVDVHLGDRAPQLDLRGRVGGLVEVPLVGADQIEPLLHAPIAALERDVRTLLSG